MANDDGHISSLVSVGRGAGFFVIGKFATQVFGFASTFFLTNSLGAEKYGVYAFALTVASLLAGLSNFGADKAILKFLPAYDQHQSQYWSYSAALAYLGGGLVSLAMFTIAPRITAFTMEDPWLTLTLRVFAGLLLIKIGLQVSNSAFRALDRPDLNTLVSQVTVPSVKMVIFGVLAAIGGSYISFLYGLIAATGVGALAGLVVLFTQTRVRPTWPNGVATREYLNFSLPAAVKDAGSILYNRIDILMLGYFATASGVGVYHVAILLGGLISLPLTGMNRIFPSMVSKLYSDGDEETLEQLYRSVTRWTVTAALPIAIGVTVYRNVLLSLLGDEFTTGGGVLVVLLLGHFINTAVGPSGYLLMMTDHQRLVTLNQWMFGIVNVGLNYILITRIGILGAAVATTMTLAGLNLVRIIQVILLEGWFPYSRQLSKPVLAAAGMIVAISGVNRLVSGVPSLVAGGAIGGVVFLGILYWCGITDADQVVFKELFSAR